MKKALLLVLSALFAMNLSACGFIKKVEEAPPAESPSTSPSQSAESESSSSKPEEPPAPSTSSSAEEDKAGPSPQDALEQMLAAAKTLDTDTVNLYAFNIPGGYPAPLEEFTNNSLKDIDYTVGTARMDGQSKAYVDLTITAVNAASAKGEITRTILAVIAKQKFSGKSTSDPEELLDLVMDSVKLDKLPTETTDTAVLMELHPDGYWKADLGSDENRDLANALSGGVLVLMDELRDMAKEYGIDF